MLRVKSCLVSGFATLVLATACNDPQGSEESKARCGSGAATERHRLLRRHHQGSDIPPGGYAAWVDFYRQPVSPNGLVTFTGLSPGDHIGALYGVASNCWVLPSPWEPAGLNPRWVLVTADVAGNTSGSESFYVACYSVGSLFVSTRTTGVDLPNGYTVTVDGSFSQPIAANGSVTLTGVATGSHSVTLSGVAGNCTVTGSTSQTVTVSAGGTASGPFSLSCAPIGIGSGSLAVTTSTTGSPPPAGGYTVTIDGSFSQPIATNGSVAVTGPAGGHPVALSGVAANCTVSGANPRTVTVPAGGAGTTTFSITCSAQQPSPEVIGQVQLGMGSPTTGNHVQTFDFDVRADLTGRFTITDYYDIQKDGKPASLTTDPSTDPATSITAYRNTSKVCSDPSRGVEFDAVGRERYGILASYTVLLCDNGPPGSGMDFLSIFLPSEGYGRSGSVTSGDIAKR